MVYMGTFDAGTRLRGRLDMVLECCERALTDLLLRGRCRRADEAAYQAVWLGSRVPPGKRQGLSAL